MFLITVQALITRPELILNPDYRTPENLERDIKLEGSELVDKFRRKEGKEGYLRLDPHYHLVIHSLTINGEYTILNAAELPRAAQVATASVQFEIHYEIAGKEAVEVIAVVSDRSGDLSIVSNSKLFLLLFRLEPIDKKSLELLPPSLDDGEALHRKICRLHHPMEPPKELPVKAVSTCPLSEGPVTASPVDPITGRGLPVPELRDPRGFPAHGKGEWPRLRFTAHHLMSGDRYAMWSTLILYPNAFLELISFENDVAGHIDFFRTVLPPERFLFQILETRVPRVLAPEHVIPHQTTPGQTYWTARVNIGTTPSAGTYWENCSPPGAATYLVGKAFQENPAAAKGQLLQALQQQLPLQTFDAICKYAATKFSKPGVYVALWIRNEKNGPVWNMTEEAYAQLHQMVNQIQQKLGSPVTLLHSGSPLSGFVRGDGLIEYWEDPGFPSVDLHPSSRGNRAFQLAFWHCAASLPGRSIIHIGIRSGGLEQLALMGMRTIYLEPEEQAQQERGERMRQWVGRLPYSRCVISDYPSKANDKKFPEVDYFRILAMLHDALRRELDANHPPSPPPDTKRDDLWTVWHHPGWCYLPTPSDSIYEAFLILTRGVIAPKIPEKPKVVAQSEVPDQKRLNQIAVCKQKGRQKYYREKLNAIIDGHLPAIQQLFADPKPSIQDLKSFVVDRVTSFLAGAKTCFDANTVKRLGYAKDASGIAKALNQYVENQLMPALPINHANEAQLAGESQFQYEEQQRQERESAKDQERRMLMTYSILAYDREIRERVIEFESENFTTDSESRHPEPKYRGRENVDDYTLACCFQQPLAIHFVYGNSSGDVRYIGGQERALHIACYKTPNGEMFYPMYPCPEQWK